MNKFYQSAENPNILLNDSGDKYFLGQTKNLSVKLAIDERGVIIRIETNFKIGFTYKTDFLILEALDNAKFNLYKYQHSIRPEDNLLSSLVTDLNSENRVSTYINNLTEIDLWACGILRDEFDNLLNWYNLYNSKHEHIDIIEFVFYLNNMTEDRLAWCLQNYKEKPEIIYD